jgi:hypothetical protein
LTRFCGERGRRYGSKARARGRLGPESAVHPQRLCSSRQDDPRLRGEGQPRRARLGVIAQRAQPNLHRRPRAARLQRGGGGSHVVLARVCAPERPLERHAPRHVQALLGLHDHGRPLSRPEIAALRLPCVRRRAEHPEQIIPELKGDSERRGEALERPLHAPVGPCEGGADEQGPAHRVRSRLERVHRLDVLRATEDIHLLADHDVLVDLAEDRDGRGATDGRGGRRGER